MNERPQDRRGAAPPGLTSEGAQRLSEEGRRRPEAPRQRGPGAQGVVPRERRAGGRPPGLAEERTTLAWTRSSISFTAIGLLILKTRPLVGAPILILSAIIWSIGLMGRTPGQAGVARKRVLFVTICVTVIASIALVVALAGYSPRGLRL